METTQASFSHSLRENPMGQARKDALRLHFNRRVKVEFHGTKVTSDAGLLAYRELDEALRKALPTTATSSAHAIIRCSASINAATWSERSFAMAMFTVQMTGRAFWSRSLLVIEATTSSGSFVAMLALPIPMYIGVSKPRDTSMRSG
jgi:hypothetical protein